MLRVSDCSTASASRANMPRRSSCSFRSRDDEDNDNAPMRRLHCRTLSIVCWLGDTLARSLVRHSQGAAHMNYRDDVRFPPSQKALLDAHDTFLRDSWAVVTKRKVRLPNLADQVAYAVFGQLLQLARTVRRLAEVGYGGESKPLARAT